MIEYDERFILMKRQIESLQNAVKFYQEQLDNNNKKINNLQEMVVNMSTQLQTLTQNVAILKVTSMGHGSTVRV